MNVDYTWEQLKDHALNGRDDLGKAVLTEAFVIRFEDGKAAAGWKGPRIGGTK